MMREGAVYECVDERKNVDTPLDGIAMIFVIPNALEVRTYEGPGKVFKFDDDDQVEDSEKVITFHMPEGKIHFVELNLSDYTRLDGQSSYGTPDFKTTEELQAWFREAIELF